MRNNAADKDTVVIVCTYDLDLCYGQLFSFLVLSVNGIHNRAFFLAQE